MNYLVDILKREEGQRPEESLQPIDDETAIQTTQTRTLKKLHKSGAPCRMSRTPHRCSRLRLPQRSPPLPGSGACCASRTPPSSSRTSRDRTCSILFANKSPKLTQNSRDKSLRVGTTAEGQTTKRAREVEKQI